METQRKRFNWRVSEGVAAELIQARRLAGCRSWDEYFLSLRRSSQTPALQSSPLPPDEIKALRREHQELKNELAALRNLLEAQEQARQADEHEHAETREMLRRFYELLSLALAPEEPEPEKPHTMTRGQAVLDAIRHRRSIS
ncbi:MAG: hypothetical protein IT578_06460 [Verrucomicrobiae bacterium]|nr:hypothetical protein [Verrucomicrobiae bacterium]